ncbi:MAG: DNA polymerase III subunit beta [Microthrixaceae bacterium]
MKFRCERDVLVEGLTTAGRAASSRGGVSQVLAGVHLSLHGDQLTITGTDMELTIGVEITVSGKADGAIVVPAKLAADIVKSLEPGAVTVDGDRIQARIISGRSEFAVQLIPAEEFPQITAPEGEAVVISGSDLSDGLRQVVPSASTDDSRVVLTGVLITAEGSGVRLVATDSYRLAVRDLPGTTLLEQGRHVLVPARALQEIGRLLSPEDELTMVFGERDASFVTHGVRLLTRLIDGTYPEAVRLIPDEQPNRMLVGRSTLIDAVRRVRLMARESTPIRLKMSSEGLELAAVTQDVGQAHESLDCDYRGDEIMVAFNPEFLLTGLEVTTGDEVTIESTNSLKPVLLRSGEDPDFLYLLMPVRVS